jgi:hypothetical protein
MTFRILVVLGGVAAALALGGWASRTVPSANLGSGPANASEIGSRAAHESDGGTDDDDEPELRSRARPFPAHESDGGTDDDDEPELQGSRARPFPAHESDGGTDDDDEPELR